MARDDKQENEEVKATLLMKKPLRPCKEINCAVLTREGYCETHRISETEKHREYNQTKRDHVVDRFYKSTVWTRLRKVALERDNYLCQVCKRDKRYTPAKIVHHLVEVKVDWERRLELDNLESVCHPCHNRIHGSGRI
jgi:5-methylcytosine-specific restriction enzyme A